MLTGFEVVCSACNGTKLLDPTTPCDICQARGSVPTAQGIALLEFIQHHMFMNGTQVVKEAVERRFQEYLKKGN
jgi:hypothetical protein